MVYEKKLAEIMQMTPSFQVGQIHTINILKIQPIKGLRGLVRLHIIPAFCLWQPFFYHK